MKRACIAGSLAMLVAGCGGSTQGAVDSAAALQARQLRISDVPAAFYLEKRYRLPADQTAQWQHIDRSQYMQRGGRASLSESYVLRHPVAAGVTFIFSQLIAFTSASGARWGFQQLRAALAHSGTIGTDQEYVNVLATPTPLPTIIAIIKHPLPPPITRYEPTRAPPLGDEDAGFTNTSAAYAGEYVFTNQVVLFRRGRYCGVVHTSGNYGQVPMSTALALARRIDLHIREAKT
ncbi:MAG TPA: hypothetical protein VF221_20800 [Chloroflexota bacterium]